MLLFAGAHPSCPTCRGTTPGAHGQKPACGTKPSWLPAVCSFHPCNKAPRRDPAPAPAPALQWEPSPCLPPGYKPCTKAGEEGASVRCCRDSRGLWQRRERAARKDGSLNHSTGCNRLRCGCSVSQGGLLFVPHWSSLATASPWPGQPDLHGQSACSTLQSELSPSNRPGPPRQPEGIQEKAGFSR